MLNSSDRNNCSDYSSRNNSILLEVRNTDRRRSPDLSCSVPCRDPSEDKGERLGDPTKTLEDSSVELETGNFTKASISEADITPGSTSSEQKLVIGSARFPGADKWGDAQPKPPHFISFKPTLIPEGYLSSSSNSEESAAYLPSALPRLITDQSEQSHDSEPEAFAVGAAADCFHAQDFTMMIEVLGAAPDKTLAVLFGRGLAYYRLLKFPEAIQNFNDMSNRVAALRLLQHGDMYLAQYYLGEIEFSCKNFRNAAKHFEKAAKSYSSETVAKRYLMVPPSLANVFFKLGSAFRQAQLIMEAVQAYKNALIHAENKKERQAAHTSLGNLYQTIGEQKSALEHYEAAVNLADELGDNVSLAWAYGNMGNAYLGLFENDKALEFLTKSLDLTIAHEPTPQAIGRVYNNIGTAYQSMKMLDQAQEYYDMALNQAIYGMDEAGEARVRGNYGNLLMMQKKYDSAISHYTEALDISIDRSIMFTAYHNRGCAYYEKSEAEKKKILETKLDKKNIEFYVTFTGPNTANETKELELGVSLKESYKKGLEDFTMVVEYHEETFQTMRGSPQGLNLSVSLFETNSRSFHRLQDCLYNVQDWGMALEYAEQSRARTLGELLLLRNYGQHPLELTSPLRTKHIKNIIEFVGNIVVYVSYTGSRLLTWVFTPCAGGKAIANMFQVAVDDDQFDKKSLDYYLRYLLEEVLIEKGVEMYGRCSYETSPALNKLYRLFAEPLLTILDKVNANKDSYATIQDVIIIPDSYTSLMPLFALFDDKSTSNVRPKFLGDRFRFRIMPSLLTLGVLCRLPPAVVQLPEDSHKFCIVGNPSIPTFSYREKTWSLGRLPFATLEAEYVAYILECTPILHEKATKNVVLNMISEAKVVHLATHGSAVAGFLAFSGLVYNQAGLVNSKNILLHPEEVEKLRISPALVVLSSCDSGRGTVKADGIQGMARAFILAGARAVLTTLWRVPDESAASFMKFFYQYMTDGFKASHALQKAMLSIRCFQKYSKYIHWSGYQLTGQDVEFVVKKRESKVGRCPVFPQLDIVGSLEKIFIKDCYLPTNIQVSTLHE